ncbi:tyrosine-type recombinase/integrase [Altericroceibacterium spongiae]|uniref:tyrosine-type recombinase/integrase n=1 Tax=Altericroceibacterium spongiae TaxID=2320269 RepID=UPI001EE57F3C|nr:integrase arm-type DNA-binding domain-containing protein [Altericroceibacterium spongiae]
MAENLSDTRVRKAAAKASDYKITDGKGLFVLVRPNGSKLWRMRYRFAGKEKLLSFGPYPEVSLAEAREKRDQARKLVRDGVDPSLEKKRRALSVAQSSGYSVERVSREWFELNKGRWTPVHSNDVIHSLERDVFSHVGSLPIADLDQALLIEVLRKIERRGAIETAKRVRQRLSGVFFYAQSLGIVRDNPAEAVISALKPKPKSRRQAAVTDLSELQELLRKSEGSGAYPVTLLASRLLALTAVRPGVIRGAQWSEFSGFDMEGDEEAPEALWTIPAERMKLALTRKDEGEFDHLVPLAPTAVETIRAVHRLTGRGALTFPSQRHAHKPLSENAIGYLYNRVGWHGRHVPHGWRAAFSTIMNEWAKEHGRADDRAVIDLMLAHLPKEKVEAAYNRAQFMPRRRQLANKWADMLMEGARPAAELLTVARR